MSGLRVALLEDHDLFADALALALAVHGHDVIRMAIPDHVRSVDSLVAPLLDNAPDVVLLDLDLGLAGSASRIIEPLARAGIAVVVVTGSTDRAQWGECLHLGARRVVPKVAALQDVVSTLRRIEMGVPVIARERRRALIEVWRREEADRRSERERLASLTHREREVLGQLVDGRQVQEIARADVVSPATVRSQVKSILGKLQVGSQIAAVGMVHRVRTGAELREPVDAV